MAELEEYIYSLEVHIAYQNKERLAAAKPIPFKIMPKKNFTQKKVTIQNLQQSNDLLEDPLLQESKKPLTRKHFEVLANEVIS